MKRVNNFKQLTLTLLFLMGLMICQVKATDGYFSNGVGIKYRAMAGAGAGLHLSPMAAATNPGAMSFVGKALDINLSIFNPNRKFSVTGNPTFRHGTFGLAPGTVESGKNIFVIPTIGANWMLNDNMSFGVMVYGNGGMDTSYDSPVFGFQTTGIDLIQMFVAPTFSMKFAEKHSLGISPILGYQVFEANGVLAFGTFSSDANNISNNGDNSTTGFGVKVGYLGKFTDFLSVGASIQSPIKMGTFEKYGGLFAEGGDFDIPMNWTVGVALQFDKFGLALDLKQIMYSQVNSIGNPMLPNLQQAGLGTENGAGFGWQDMTVVKVGVHYALKEDLTLRAGFSTGNQPIPESEVLFNVLAPGVVENHISFGVSKDLPNGKELNFFVTHALENTVSGPNPLEFPGIQTIALTMNQWEFGVGFTFGKGARSKEETTN